MPTTVPYLKPRPIVPSGVHDCYNAENFPVFLGMDSNWDYYGDPETGETCAIACVSTCRSTRYWDRAGWRKGLTGWLRNAMLTPAGSTW